jgi:hypothetical protein
MANQTLVGNKVTQLPIAKAVGTQVSPAKAGSASMAAPSIPVPPPGPLVINGRRIQIDVRSMSGADIVALLNGIPGVKASIDGAGSLVISGVDSIDGASDLRAILGI